MKFRSEIIHSMCRRGFVMSWLKGYGFILQLWAWQLSLIYWKPDDKFDPPDYD